MYYVFIIIKFNKIDLSSRYNTSTGSDQLGQVRPGSKL